MRTPAGCPAAPARPTGGRQGLDLDEAPPEHSTISRTRRLIDLETHLAVFTWILQVLATTDLVKGQTIGIDATTLEANAALRSIVRRDSGETYQEFLTRLAQASGIETPTRADLARVDRKRPKKGRNTDWRHPHDPDARITKMKDGTPQGVNPRSRWRRPPCRVLTHSDGTIASRSLHMVLYRGWTFDCTPVVWLLRRVPRRAGHTVLPAQGLQPRRIVQSSIATPSSTSRNCSTSGASSSPIWTPAGAGALRRSHPAVVHQMIALGKPGASKIGR